MEKELSLLFSGLSHTGKVRAGNEDCYGIGLDGSVIDLKDGQSTINSVKNAMMVVVADGMGGAEAGEIASNIAANSVLKRYANESSWLSNDEEIRSKLIGYVYDAHLEIIEYSKSNPNTTGMGSTIVIGLFIQNKVHVAWCGDSRAYKYNASSIADNQFYESQHLRVCTHDHSIVWDSVLKGTLSPEEARVHPQSNIITQSLGAQEILPHVDAYSYMLSEGDKWLFCSDGLNGMLKDVEIEEILHNDLPVSDLNNMLFDSAMVGGGEDNITSILISLKHVPQVTDVHDQSTSALPAQSRNRPEMITKVLTEYPNGDLSNSKTKSKKSLHYLLMGLVFGLVVLVFFLMKQIKVNKITDNAKGNELVITEGNSIPAKLVLEPDTTNKNESKIMDKDFSISSDHSNLLLKKIIPELILRKEALRTKLDKVSGVLSPSKFEQFDKRIGRMAKKIEDLKNPNLKGIQPKRIDEIRVELGSIEKELDRAVAPTKLPEAKNNIENQDSGPYYGGEIEKITTMDSIKTNKK